MISILMPIYNGIEFIEDSVGSILNQTYDQWELIIGINGHPENSNIYNIAKKYEERSEPGKIRVFDFHHVKGKANTMNFMLYFCKYSHIAILDVDDIWHTNKLEVQLPFLTQFDYDVVGSNCIWFGVRDGVIPSIPLGDISDFDFKKVNPIINSSSIIRKKLCFWNHILNYIP